MARARARVPVSLAAFTRTDWETVIREAALGAEDTQIAQLYLLDAIPQVEIGAALHLERSTVSRQLLRIVDKLERTAHRLHIV